MNNTTGNNSGCGQDGLAQRVDRLYNVEIQGHTELTLERVSDEKLRMYGLALLGRNSDTSITKLSLFGQAGGALQKMNHAALLAHFVSTSVSLQQVDMSYIGSQPLLRLMLTAAAVNPNVVALHLGWIPAMDVMIGFALKSSIKQLTLTGGRIQNFASRQVSVNLQTAFGMNSSLKCLRLSSWDFNEKTPFSTLAGAIGKSNSVTSIELEGCQFNAASTSALLKLVKQSPNINELYIGMGCSFGNDNFNTICQKLLETKSLTKLRIRSGDLRIRELYQTFHKNDNNKLVDCLHLDILNYDQFHQLVTYIPFLPVDKLVLDIPPYIRGKLNEMVHAMRKNHFVKRFQIQSKNMKPLIVINDTLKKLGERNMTLQQWRKHDIPKACYMPSVVTAGLEYESKSDILFDVFRNHWIPQTVMTGKMTNDGSI